jgi:hypothetical protein
LENQIIIKSLGAIKPKGLNRIATISYGNLCLREEILRFNNKLQYFRKLISITNISNKPCQYRNTDYRVDDALGD